MIIDFRLPDSEYEAAFTAYRNYFGDLAGVIGGTYGLGSTSLVGGVQTAVLASPKIASVQRKKLTANRQAELDKRLRSTWSGLYGIYREVEDFDFDEEANAQLPSQCYYAIYHAALGYAIASNQPPTRDHTAVRKMLGRLVTDGWLPHPWSAYCRGCPQLDDTSFGGLVDPDGEVHVLSRPDPDSSDARYAMLLRTTRKKELDRLFRDEREKKSARDKRPRNLNRTDKQKLAGALAPTTLFDVVWRMRKKTHYDDADVFVLGAAGEQDARSFAEGLVIVTGATVAALEALTVGQVGPTLVAESADAYKTRRSVADRSRLDDHLSPLIARGRTVRRAPQS
jgi:hypothetical protein